MTLEDLAHALYVTQGSDSCFKLVIKLMGDH